MQNCWLVWRTDTGEIVSIEDADAGAGTELERSQRRLSRMGEGVHFPTMGRWLPVTNVTRELLLEEADHCIRVSRRGVILQQWAQSPTEALVQILERGEYQRPYVGADDAEIVLELLFHLHADELAGPRRDLRDRLSAIAAAEVYEPRVTAKLRRQLAVADLDGQALKKIWSGITSNGGIEAFQAGEPFRDIWFMEEFGDVRSTDPEIIDWLIAAVAQPGMFGPRWMATIALGKIGPPAGARAVEVIRANILDSSPGITKMRELVIKRITSPADEWSVCTQCHRGRILPLGKPFSDICPKCMGFGVSHIGENGK